MIRKFASATTLVALAASARPFPQKQRARGLDANGNLDALIARHAAANNLPEDLVRRIIKRESGGNPRVRQRRQLRPDADQARDRALDGLHAATPPACSMPTPT